MGITSASVVAFRAVLCGVMLLAAALSADALPLFPGGNHAGEDHSNESHAGEDVRDIVLSGANLSGSDFSSVFASGANLTNANLSGTNFADAVMWDAIFAGATITSDTLFAGTDLSGAVLSGLDLRRTTIGQALSLDFAVLRNADLSGLDLSGVEVREVYLDGAQVVGTNLTDAVFDSAIGTNFSNAIMVRARLDEESMSNAIFRNADLRYAYLEGELENNDFSGADMRYSRIDLEGGSFRNANFANADLRSATLRVSTDLGTGQYEGANWTGARICGTVFVFEVPDTTGAIGCSVPEPTTFSLMALAIGAVGWSMRRRLRGTD